MADGWLQQLAIKEALVAAWEASVAGDGRWLRRRRVARRLVAHGGRPEVVACSDGGRATARGDRWWRGLLQRWPVAMAGRRSWCACEKKNRERRKRGRRRRWRRKKIKKIKNNGKNGKKREKIFKIIEKLEKSLKIILRLEKHAEGSKMKI